MNDVQATTHDEIDERFKEMSDSEIVETTEGLLRSALKNKEDIFIPSLNCSVRKRAIELAKQLGSVYNIHNQQRLESRRIIEDNEEQKRRNELEKLRQEQDTILNESLAALQSAQSDFDNSNNVNDQRIEQENELKERKEILDKLQETHRKFVAHCNERIKVKEDEQRREKLELKRKFMDEDKEANHVMSTIKKKPRPSVGMLHIGGENLFDHTNEEKSDDPSHEPYDPSHEPYDPSHEPYDPSHEPYDPSHEPYDPSQESKYEDYIDSLISEPSPHEIRSNSGGGRNRNNPSPPRDPSPPPRVLSSLEKSALDNLSQENYRLNSKVKSLEDFELENQGLRKDLEKMKATIKKLEQSLLALTSDGHTDDDRFNYPQAPRPKGANRKDPFTKEKLIWNGQYLFDSRRKKWHGEFVPEHELPGSRPRRATD
jgi:hypothetical protein